MTFHIERCVFIFLIIYSMMGVFWQHLAVSGLRSSSHLRTAMETNMRMGDGKRRMERNEEEDGEVPNPQRNENDMRGTYSKISAGRSKAQAPTWPGVGVPIFYNPAHFANSTLNYEGLITCVLRKALNIINKYACITIVSLGVNDKCSPPHDTIACVRNSFAYTEKLIYKGIDPKLVTNYIWLQHKGEECWSRVGRDPDPNDTPGRQIINLGEFCIELSLVIHEIIHALGFHHEHQRYDRDDYIKIYPDHVADGQLDNFDKETIKTRDLGPYDIESIMHYDKKAQTKRWKLETISVKNKTLAPFYYSDPVYAEKVRKKFGRLQILSFSDKIKIQSVTRCEGAIGGTNENVIDYSLLLRGVLAIDRKQKNVDLKKPMLECTNKYCNPCPDNSTTFYQDDRPNHVG